MDKLGYVLPLGVALVDPPRRPPDPPGRGLDLLGEVVVGHPDACGVLVRGDHQLVSDPAAPLDRLVAAPVESRHVCRLLPRVGGGRLLGAPLGDPPVAVLSVLAVPLRRPAVRAFPPGQPAGVTGPLRRAPLRQIVVFVVAAGVLHRPCRFHSHRCTVLPSAPHLAGPLQRGEEVTVTEAGGAATGLLL